MKKVSKRLSDKQQKKIAAARTAALGVDRDDLIDQAQQALAIRDVMQMLRAAREAAGISLRELEAKTGISRGNLSRLESFDGNPTISTLERYAKAIGRKLLVTLE